MTRGVSRFGAESVAADIGEGVTFADERAIVIGASAGISISASTDVDRKV